MEHKDQNPLETFDSRMGEGSLERSEKNSVHRPYRSPRVTLVGEAKQLMAAWNKSGNDGSGWDILHWG
ncbi:MAG: hypothetical protein E6J34_10895 [Chloroflexi bacterium]|nr:MAG: hypothetical protein E6J34_10895 [Chloroflexota bacterium]